MSSRVSIPSRNRNQQAFAPQAIPSQVLSFFSSLITIFSTKANAIPLESPVSSAKIPSSVDRQMDKQIPTNGVVEPGISMAHGPVTEQDTHMAEVNGAVTNGTMPAKRKARESIARPDYADAESSDDEPMVCAVNPFLRQDQFD